MEAQTNVEVLIARGIRRAGCVAVAVALLLTPTAASADNFTVANTNDSGGGSLRQAILGANSSVSTTDTITVTATGTVHLLSALPTIGGGTTINGPGQSQFVVNGEDSFQVMKVNVGTVSISGLTITHGRCDTTNSGTCGFTGGGLLNNGGTVTLTNVAVTANSLPEGGQGGGLYNGGTMTLNNSVVSSNTVVQSGQPNNFPQAGGIFNNGTLTLTKSTVSGNSATATGGSNQNAPDAGGIYNNTSGTVNLDRSTIDSNQATADAQGAGGTTNAVGGGIINNGTLNVVRSTLSDNSASASNGTSNTARGGGIAQGASADLTIDRSTISGNSTTSVDTSQVGGVEIDGSTITITSATIANNSAASGANLGLFTNATYKNTIIAGPQGGGDNCVGLGGQTSLGHNIDEDGTCNLGDPTDQQVNPMLAATLAFNGGPTKTYSLQPGSPAIDKGQSSVGETVDQRGRPRPHNFPNIANGGGDGTDIGAFEAQPANTTITSGPKGTTFDPTPTFTFSSSEPGSTFQCKVDAKSFAACTSPRTLAHLGDGSHTFQVRAKDVSGTFDPSPASRTFDVTTALVQRSGSTLVVTAAPSAKDNFKITKPDAATIRVTNLPAGAFTASGVHVGTGCTRSGDYTANCSAAPITTLKVSTGTAPDRVLNMTSLPSMILGGSSADALAGGSAADTITGGTGADSLQGNAGKDNLLARDGTTDPVIDCGAGAGDKARADDLPKDSAVSGCETVTRQ